MRRVDVRVSEHGSEKSPMVEHMHEQGCEFDKSRFSIFD